MFGNEASRRRGELWLKALAQADTRGGQIVLKDCSEIGQSSATELAQVLDDLLDDLQMAVGTFNDYRGGRDKVSLVVARQDGCNDGPVAEIGLLLSGRRVRIAREGLALVVKVTVHRMYQARSWVTRRFVPEPDGTGGVLWRMDGGSNDGRDLVERSHLVKYLLSDLVRVAG